MDTCHSIIRALLLPTVVIVFAIYYHLINSPGEGYSRLRSIFTSVGSFYIFVASTYLTRLYDQLSIVSSWVMLVSGAAVVCREKSERDCCFDFENAVLLTAFKMTPPPPPNVRKHREPSSDLTIII